MIKPSVQQSDAHNRRRCHEAFSFDLGDLRRPFGLPSRAFISCLLTDLAPGLAPQDGLQLRGCCLLRVRLFLGGETSQLLCRLPRLLFSRRLGRWTRARAALTRWHFSRSSIELFLLLRHSVGSCGRKSFGLR